MVIWLLNKNTATPAPSPGRRVGAVTSLHGAGWWDTAPRLERQGLVRIAGDRFSLNLLPVCITMVTL